MILGPDGRPLTPPTTSPDLSQAGAPPVATRKVDADEMAENNIRWSTWHITLPIQLSADHSDIRYRAYYVRGPYANDASMLAIDYWKKWERTANGEEYPCVASYPGPDTIAMAIDEGDFMNAWKAAKRSGHFKYAGEKKRPFAFTFKKSEEFDVINTKDDKLAWNPKQATQRRV